uniref:Uncharacterized protein n=1 Tax=Myoviridae sp. ctTOm1 TaxID=2826657 RepID=A0A8S5N4M5_9CAUD|nr:MAG TPA: hypothetical protein [Myoviridae sp. ctTOm1]
MTARQNTLPSCPRANKKPPLRPATRKAARRHGKTHCANLAVGHRAGSRPVPRKRHTHPGRAAASAGQPLSFSRMPPWLRHSVPAKGSACPPFPKRPLQSRTAAHPGAPLPPACAPELAPGPAAACPHRPNTANMLSLKAHPAYRGLCRLHAAGARASLRSARIPSHSFLSSSVW